MIEAHVAGLEERLADDVEDGALFVAEQIACGREVVGFVACFLDRGGPDPCVDERAKALIVHDLTVTTDERGHGTARALMDAVRIFACDRAIDRIVIAVPANEASSLRAHEALGFRCVTYVLESPVR